MMDEKATYQIAKEVMTLFENVKKDESEHRKMWQMLNELIKRAKLDVVEDAEKQISKLRVFSLGR